MKDHIKYVNGWWVPRDDNYFDKLLSRGDFKKNGFQREHLLEAFKHVKKWDNAVDVGAHVGLWAHDMAQKFGKVWCFEPSPHNFACLAKNMAGYDNVSLSAVALGDKSSRCSVGRDGDRKLNSGSEHVIVSRDGPVRMVSLDSCDLPGCDLLKVDVEGFELMVLRGAKKTIKRFKPTIIMETDKKFARKRYGWQDSEASRFLTMRDYKEVWHGRPDRVFVYDPPSSEE
jgi:FkbM family methyltransferase